MSAFSDIKGVSFLFTGINRNRMLTRAVSQQSLVDYRAANVSPEVSTEHQQTKVSQQENLSMQCCIHQIQQEGYKI